MSIVYINLTPLEAKFAGMKPGALVKLDPPRKTKELIKAKKGCVFCWRIPRESEAIL
jgi:hypothetical protein